MSIAAAIVYGDRVLAIRRRDNDKWEPPGGTLEPHETIEAGLRREVLEETGLTITNPVLTGVYKNMSKTIVALVFRCEFEGEPVGSTDETAEVAWLTPDEIELRMDQAYAVRLLDALASQAPNVRAHDGTQVLDHE